MRLRPRKAVRVVRSEKRGTKGREWGALGSPEGVSPEVGPEVNPEVGVDPELWLLPLTPRSSEGLR